MFDSVNNVLIWSPFAGIYLLFKCPPLRSLRTENRQAFTLTHIAISRLLVNMNNPFPSSCFLFHTVWSCPELRCQRLEGQAKPLYQLQKKPSECSLMQTKLPQRLSGTLFKEKVHWLFISSPTLIFSGVSLSLWGSRTSTLGSVLFTEESSVSRPSSSWCTELFGWLLVVLTTDSGRY